MEILGVLAVIAVIAVVSVPSWSYFSASTKLRGERDKLVSNLYSVQQRSVAEQYNYIVKFRPDTNSYKVIKLVPDEDDPLSVSEIETGSFTVEGVILESTTFKNNELEFTPFGSASYGGSIILKNQKGKESIIEVSPSGVIK